MTRLALFSVLSLLLTVLTFNTDEGFAEEIVPQETELPEGVEKSEIAPPEILALTWQIDSDDEELKANRKVWRPDGTVLPLADAVALLEEIKYVDIHRVQQGYEDKVSRTLIVLSDPGSKLPAVSAGVRMQGKFFSDRIRSGGTSMHRTSGLKTSSRMFAVSAITISMNSIHKLNWPDEVDLRAKYPIEEPVLLKTVKELPAEEIEIAEGVSWMASESRRDPGFAGTMKIIRDESTELTSYFAKIYLQDNPREVRSRYSTFQGGGEDGPIYGIVVSASFDPEKFDRVEIYRQHYAYTLYPNVKIRNDLVPEADGPKGE